MQLYVSACARPQRRVPDCHVHGHHVRDAEPTRQRRARDHPLLSLRTRDCRSQIGGCRPLAQREFLPCVTCDYQTRYSYFYSCTLSADLLQISLCKSQPTAGRLPLPLSNLYLHTARVGLWTDRLEVATVDLRFFVCRFVSRWIMYGLAMLHCGTAHTKTLIFTHSTAVPEGSSKPKETRHSPYRVGRVEYQKRFRTPWELTQEPSPGRANSLVHLPYPKAQCVRPYSAR